MRSYLKTEIPAGVRDVLPSEAGFKRKMEGMISATFERWGYQEVVTPVFEYFDVLKLGQREEQIAQMYKFIDRQGRILALRPDMTTPIARLTASRLKEFPLPLRLFYIANVFSYEEPQVGRQREYYQAGIELIGYQNPEADAEVLAAAVEVLRNVGLQNFKFSMGQVDVFNGLMEELDFSEDVRKEIKLTVSNKNFVGVEELLNKQGLSGSDINRVMKIITLRGGRAKIEEAKNLLKSEKALKALENLEEVYTVLSDYQLDQYVDLDLGLLRDFDYYTGLVFEGFSPALGFPICGGGRYDRLTGHFGVPHPATGFALGIERVIMALEKEGQEVQADSPEYLINYAPERRAEAFAKARELRASGHKVILRNKGLDLPAEAFGQKESIDFD